MLSLLATRISKRLIPHAALKAYVRLEVDISAILTSALRCKLVVNFVFCPIICREEAPAPAIQFVPSHYNSRNTNDVK